MDDAPARAARRRGANRGHRRRHEERHLRTACRRSPRGHVGAPPLLRRRRGRRRRRSRHRLRGRPAQGRAGACRPHPRPDREGVLQRVKAYGLLARWGLLIVFLIVFGAFSAWIPNRFPTSGNVQDILTSQPPGIFIAYAAMLVLVVGEFDLSIGATLGISQYLVLKLITHYGLSWEAAIIATLACDAAIGLVNAIAVVGLGINSFIATIGVATILEGLVQWISDGNSPIFGRAPHGLTTLAQTKGA